MNTRTQPTSRRVLRWSALTASLSLVAGLGACSGMTTQERNTAIGAGAGAVGGAVLSGGSTAGTLGGAAIGGVIGNQIDKK
jgi:osmotically inducible lipoprotein OsmB